MFYLYWLCGDVFCMTLEERNYIFCFSPVKFLWPFLNQGRFSSFATAINKELDAFLKNARGESGCGEDGAKREIRTNSCHC